MLILLFEAIFIGIYSLLLYILLSKLLNNTTILFWFILGFIKHSMAYSLYLHHYYCKYGYACCNNKKQNANTTYLLSDSIYEGLLFIIIGFLWMPLFKNKYLGIFLCLMIIHFIMEFSKVHSHFCKTRCS